MYKIEKPKILFFLVDKYEINEEFICNIKLRESKLNFLENSSMEQYLLDLCSYFVYESVHRVSI